MDKTDHLHGNKSNVNRIDLEFAVPQNFFTHDHGYAKNINSLSNYHRDGIAYGGTGVY